MVFVSRDPFTEKVIATYKESSDVEIERSLKKCEREHLAWASLSINERLSRLRDVFRLMQASRERLAQMITKEMGKPIIQARAEIDKSLSLLPYYESVAESIFSPSPVTTAFGRAEIHHRPLGTILGIMPWNFPVWQVIRFAVPALLSGNAVIIKHAENVQGVARLLSKIFSPLPAYAHLRLSRRKTQKLLSHPKIRGVSLTGSVQAGVAVAQTAGRYLKKSVLELGGSDAYLIFEDADIELAARICAESRLVNAGQSCVSAKRFIVMKSISKSFQEAFRTELQKVTFSNPFEDGCLLGPLARKDLRDHVHSQTKRSLSQGGKLLLGGILPKEKGYFYEPTLLSNISPGMATFEEEVFGPVASLIVASSEAQAVTLANKSSFGLGACLISRDPDRLKNLARMNLEVGMVAINMPVRSDPSLPFGGVKDSGYGRELGLLGPMEFVNSKVVVSA